MGSFSLVHWVIVLVVALVLFGGRGKISSIMGDFAKGIKAFKHGMKEGEEGAEAATPPPAQVLPPAATTTQTTAQPTTPGATTRPLERT
jgi:sec-independent protein translocase protein TatA